VIKDLTDAERKEMARQMVAEARARMHAQAVPDHIDQLQATSYQYGLLALSPNVKIAISAPSFKGQYGRGQLVNYRLPEDLFVALSSDAEAEDLSRAMITKRLMYLFMAKHEVFINTYFPTTLHERIREDLRHGIYTTLLFPRAVHWKHLFRPLAKITLRKLVPQVDPRALNEQGISLTISLLVYMYLNKGALHRMIAHDWPSVHAKLGDIQHGISP